MAGQVRFPAAAAVHPMGWTQLTAHWLEPGVVAGQVGFPAAAADHTMGWNWLEPRVVAGQVRFPAAAAADHPAGQVRFPAAAADHPMGWTQLTAHWLEPGLVAGQVGFPADAAAMSGQLQVVLLAGQCLGVEHKLVQVDAESVGLHGPTPQAEQVKPKQLAGQMGVAAGGLLGLLEWRQDAPLAWGVALQQCRVWEVHHTWNTAVESVADLGTLALASGRFPPARDSQLDSQTSRDPPP